MPRFNNKSEDLRNVINPKGRIDVMAYRLAEQYANSLQEKHGLKGIWDNVEGHVQEIIKKGLSGIEIPGEIKALMNIMVENRDKLLNSSSNSSTIPSNSK